MVRVLNRIYRKFAIQNIKNNKTLYIPYIITSSITIFMFYIFLAIQNNQDILQSRGGAYIKMVLDLGTYIIGIFSVIFLIYTNKFLVRNRDRELGLINMLGVDKKGISKIMIYENVILTIINLVIGIFSSLIFSTAIFLLISRFMSLKITEYIYIDFASIVKTILVYLVIFLVVLIGNIIRVRKLKPLELLKESEKGEKEPKANIILTIIGIGCMVTGYVLAQNTKNVMDAIVFFFIAVILVIIGTYLLFTTVSIAILKILKRNKKTYYKSKNMTFISSMLFRMKQNGVSLANICIISTMVLVMLVTTTALFIGGEDVINSFYPSDVDIRYDEIDEEKEKIVEEIVKKNTENKKVEIKDYYNISQYDITTVKTGSGNFKKTNDGNFSDIRNLQLFSIYDLEDYNKITGEKIDLKDNEILLYQNKENDLDNFKIDNVNFKVKENIREIDDHFKKREMSTFSIATIIVKDKEKVYEETRKDLNLNNEKEKLMVMGTSTIYFNISGDKEEIKSAIANIDRDLYEKYGLYEDGFRVFNLDNKFKGEESFKGMHTGIYLVTILLSLVFIVAMIMIIYYKQISEGLEDTKNIGILNKIGMSKKEIKRNIGKQTRAIFFTPLIISIVHLIGATNLIYNLMNVILVANKEVFIKAEIITVVVYVVFYIVVYKFSSIAYYSVINKNNK